MKKNIISAIVFGLFFLILGFFNSYHVPQIKKWVRNQIALQSNEKLPMKILVGDVGLSLLPLGIELREISGQPKGEMAKQLAPLHVDRIVLGIHFLSVLTGSRHLIDLTLEQPQITVIQRKTSGEALDLGKYEFDIPITQILHLPFHNISVLNSTLRFKSEDAELSTQISGLDINSEFSGKSISLQLQTPEFRFKKQDLSAQTKTIALELQTVADKSSIQLSSLKVQRGESTVIAAGFFEGDVRRLLFTKSSVKGRLNLDIAQTLSFASDYIRQIKVPKVSGLLDTSFQFTKDTGKDWTGGAQLRTRDLGIDKFKIGEITTDLTYENSNLIFPKIRVVNPAGEVSFEKPTIDFKDKYSFSTQVDIKTLEISQLLMQLGLPKIPLQLHTNGKVPCKGNLKPTVSIECIGSMKGHDFRVYDEDAPTKTIVALKEFRVDGSVRVDEKGVYPKADLYLGNSRGYAEGEVLYKKGFFFKYNTPEVDFKNVENLADLKFEGLAQIKGTTQGDSDYAIIDMEVGTKDFWFEDFAIGNSSAKVEYRAGTMSFKEIKGNYRTSQFLGQVSVDLLKKHLNADIRAPVVEINDLQRGLARKATLPFDAYGLGNGHVVVEGPLEFTALTYTVQSHFNQGFVGAEGFDSAVFNIRATKGNVVSEKVEMNKGAGQLILTGKGFPNGQIDVGVTGRGLQVEDFQTITDKGVGLTGLLTFDVKLKGHVLSPSVQFSGATSRVMMNNQPLQDSQAEFSIEKSSIDGKAEFLGDRVKMDFSFPMEAKRPFRLNIDTQKWDFTPLFSFISPNIRQQNYETSLSASVKLSSESGGYKKSTGSIKISEFSVRRNALRMDNVGPMSVKFNNGGVDIERFQIVGDNTDLKAETKSNLPGASSFTFGGTVDMSLLSFLTPFLQEIRGVLSVKSTIRLIEDTFNIQGSAFIDRAYAQLKDFPHPIEQLKADTTFTESRVNVNSASALFAGGRLTSDGYIRIEGYKRFPTSLSLKLDDTTLRVPRGVSSRGSGTATITGSWFPFLMEGNFVVTEGLMDRPFDQEQQNLVRRSSYLPKVLLQDTFDPVEFSIQTTLSGNYLVKNALVDTSISGSLLIRGTPSNPVLLGEIRPMKGGLIFFRDTPFTIATGLVRFDTASDFNPYLFGTATARVKSREYDTTTTQPTTPGGSSTTTVTERSRTRDYEVNLLVQGRMKNLKIALTSSPPLEEYDIISLLALGVTSQQLEKRQSGDQATDLGSAILSQNLAIKNKLFDVKISSSGAAEDTNIGDSKVTLSRQWTPKMSTSVGRTLRTNVTDAKLKYDLNSNLAAILNWEGRQQAEESNPQTKKVTNDILGVGLEYGVEFK